MKKGEMNQIEELAHEFMNEQKLMNKEGKKVQKFLMKMDWYDFRFTPKSI